MSTPPPRPGVLNDHGHAQIQSRQESARVSESAETPETAETDRPRVWPAEQLHPSKPTRWLAREHLPVGNVAVLVGDEGIGKSLWWVLVVAAITTGSAIPQIGLPRRGPRHVLLILTEDDWSSAVRPRLEVAGADLAYVHVLCTDVDGSGSPIFPADMDTLREQTNGLDLALIVVDAWLDTVTATLQVRDPQQARRALHPWRETATQTGACVLLLAHTNRLDTADTRSRFGATGALRQKARQTLYAAAPPDSSGELVLGAEKSNTAAKAAAVRYRVEAVKVREPSDDDDGTVPRLAVIGRTAASVAELVAAWRAEAARAERPPSADDKAARWLLRYATEHGLRDGEMVELPASQTKFAANAAGHNPDRLAAIVKAQVDGYAGPSAAGGPWVYRMKGCGDDE
jgi:hypothetical protein